MAEKGWRLDMAANAGLPVPNGGILLDDFYWLAVQQEVVIVEEDGRHHIPSPQALHDLLYTAVRFPKLDNPCALRPLFVCPETACPPCHHINVRDATALSIALCRLWTAVPPTDETCRRDLLIQEMVIPMVEGTAVSLPASNMDILKDNSQSIELPRLSRWARPKPDTADYVQRLQMLLRGLRRTFGDEAWKISWADDGRICWLLQIETI